MKQRRGTKAVLESVNPVVQEGQIVYEMDTNELKIGPVGGAEYNSIDFVVPKTARVVGNMSALLTAKTDKPVHLLGYHTVNDGGGGVFVWDATKNKNLHNGGTIIDPDKVFPADWDDEGLKTTWFTSGSGAGCWVRVQYLALNTDFFGTKGDGSGNDTKPLQASIDAALKETKDLYLINTRVYRISEPLRLYNAGGSWSSPHKRSIITIFGQPDAFIRPVLGATRGSIVSALQQSAVLHYVRLKGVYIHGDSDFAFKYGYDNNGFSLVSATLEDVSIDNCDEIGIRINSGWLNNFTGCFVRQCDVCYELSNLGYSVMTTCFAFNSGKDGTPVVRGTAYKFYKSNVLLNSLAADYHFNGYIFEDSKITAPVISCEITTNPVKIINSIVDINYATFYQPGVNAGGQTPVQPGVFDVSGSGKTRLGTINATSRSSSLWVSLTDTNSTCLVEINDTSIENPQAISIIENMSAKRPIRFVTPTIQKDITTPVTTSWDFYLQYLKAINNTVNYNHIISIPTGVTITESVTRIENCAGSGVLVFQGAGAINSEIRYNGLGIKLKNIGIKVVFKDLKISNIGASAVGGGTAIIEAIDCPNVFFENCILEADRTTNIPDIIATNSQVSLINTTTTGTISSRYIQSGTGQVIVRGTTPPLQDYRDGAVFIPSSSSYIFARMYRNGAWGDVVTTNNSNVYTSRQIFRNNTQAVWIQGTSEGDAATPTIVFKDSANVTLGSVGFASAGNSTMYFTGASHVRIESSGILTIDVATRIDAAVAPYYNSSSIMNAGAMDARYSRLGSANTFTGFNKLGSDAPAIKMKKVTGTTGSTAGSAVSVTLTGVAGAKIIGIQAIVRDATNGGIFPATATPELEYYISFVANGSNPANTDISLTLGAGATIILSKPFSLLITYEE